MSSFWQYLGEVLAAMDWGMVVYIGSTLLAVASLAGGLTLIILGSRWIADECGAGWNFLFIPAAITLTVLAILFASWLGIEVAPNV